VQFLARVVVARTEGEPLAVAAARDKGDADRFIADEHSPHPVGKESRLQFGGIGAGCEPEEDGTPVSDQVDRRHVAIARGGGPESDVRERAAGGIPYPVDRGLGGEEGFIYADGASAFGGRDGAEGRVGEVLGELGIAEEPAEAQILGRLARPGEGRDGPLEGQMLSEGVVEPPLASHEVQQLDGQGLKGQWRRRALGVLHGGSGEDGEQAEDYGHGGPLQRRVP